MTQKFATYEIESDTMSKGYSHIVGVDEAGRGCEHQNADVLTLNGWKHYKDIDVKLDKVLSYTDAGNMEWQSIDRVIEKDFNGELIELKNRGVHILVTPDHYFDILRRVFKRGGEGNKLKITGYKFKGRKSVNDLVSNDCIPRGGKWVSDNKNYFVLPACHKNKWDHTGKDYSEKHISMDIWLAFLGIYLAEGSVTHSKNNAYTVHIAQKKEYSYKKIYELCIKLPFKVFKGKNGIVIYNKQLHDYLKPIGNCYSKYIPTEFKGLSSRQLNILIDWMILGDGSCYTGKNRKEVCQYYTVSTKLKDDFEEVLLKAGWTYNTSVRAPRDGVIQGRLVKKENCVPCFETRLRRNNKIQVKSLHKKLLPYNGKVFCLSLPVHHNFYVRREGTGYFTGNCLSGPVVAAACHVPEEMVPELLFKVKDSKKLTAKKREELFPIIRANCDVGVGVVSNQVIDDINILNATKVAMEEALTHIKEIDYVLIDGTVVLPNFPLPQEQIIKGDAKSISIAAASIIAKVTRDRIMDDLHDIWSFYGWNTNRGYGTKAHIEALKTYGSCEVHRMTFKRVKEYIAV